MVSVDLQAGGSSILLERGDGIGVVAEQFFDMRGGLVAQRSQMTWGGGPNSVACRQSPSLATRA